MLKRATGEKFTIQKIVQFLEDFYNLFFGPSAFNEALKLEILQYKGSFFEFITNLAPSVTSFIFNFKLSTQNRLIFINSIFTKNRAKLILMDL